MRFLVDESTGAAVVDFLKSQGHDAMAVTQTMPQADDSEILFAATGVSYNKKKDIASKTRTTNMTSSELLRRAEEIYRRRWKDVLEHAHRDSFVAIEPDSEEYFLGRTLSEASAAAAAVYPERRTAVLRVGHSVTVEIGACVR